LQTAGAVSKLAASKEPTKAEIINNRCTATATLIAREAQYGTIKAARMSSITFGKAMGENGSLGWLDNRWGNFLNAAPNGQELDIDWLMDIYTKTPNISITNVAMVNGTIINLRSIAGTGAYVYGKTKWVLGKYWDNIVQGANRKVTNGYPFKDPGEQLAVIYFNAGLSFASSLARWRKLNCPQ
jgi:hypothetical protein